MILRKLIFLVFLSTFVVVEVEAKGKKKKKKVYDDDKEEKGAKDQFHSTVLLLSADGEAGGIVKFHQYEDKLNKTDINHSTGKPNRDKHGRLQNQTVTQWTVRIAGTLFGLSAGRHGLHVHESGNVLFDCRKTGPDFNPYNAQHGPPHTRYPRALRHLGDLGNIEANDTGHATFNFTDTQIMLTGNTSIIGRTLAVHQFEDNLGRFHKPIKHKESAAPSRQELVNMNHGNAGIVVACGTIGRSSVVDLEFTMEEAQPHAIRLVVISILIMLLVAAVIKCAEREKRA